MKVASNCKLFLVDQCIAGAIVPFSDEINQNACDCDPVLSNAWTSLLCTRVYWIESFSLA